MRMHDDLKFQFEDTLGGHTDVIYKTLKRHSEVHTEFMEVIDTHREEYTKAIAGARDDAKAHAEAKVQNEKSNRTQNIQACNALIQRNREDRENMYREICNTHESLSDRQKHAMEHFSKEHNKKLNHVHTDLRTRHDRMGREVQQNKKEIHIKLNDLGGVHSDAIKDCKDYVHGQIKTTRDELGDMDKRFVDWHGKHEARFADTNHMLQKQNSAINQKHSQLEKSYNAIHGAHEEYKGSWDQLKQELDEQNTMLKIHVRNQEKLWDEEKQSRHELGRRLMHEQNQLALDQVERIDGLLDSERKISSTILLKEAREQTASIIDDHISKIRSELGLQSLPPFTIPPRSKIASREDEDAIPGTAVELERVRVELRLNVENIDRRIDLLERDRGASIRTSIREELSRAGAIGTNNDGSITSGEVTALKLEIAQLRTQNKKMEESNKTIVKEMRQAMASAGTAVKMAMEEVHKAHNQKMDELMSNHRKELDKKHEEYKKTIMKLDPKPDDVLQFTSTTTEVETLVSNNNTL